MRGLSAGGLAVVAGVAAGPAMAQANVAACPPALLRWTEDCSGLEDVPRGGLQALRYAPLDEAGDAWVSVGAEHRTRVETFDRLDWGINGAPGYTAIAQRGLLHADVRSRAGPRLFVQLSVAGQDGREPGPRSFDESGPDLAQAFIDLPMDVGPTVLNLRLGRQELSLDNRLVALRDGVTLRRAFDGAKLDLMLAGATVTGFHLSPVLNGTGAFGDRTTPGETFSGVAVEFPNAEDAPVWSVYAFDRRRPLARYAEVTGKERRQTYGVRYAAGGERFDFVVQTAVQTGTMAGRSVLAWGAAVDHGWRPYVDGLTRIGLTASLASGDGDPGDGTVETFDPLYPNLGAFTDAPLLYYAYQINAQMNVQRRFGPVTLRTDATLTGRYDTADAIYVSPGRPLASPPRGDRLSALLLEASGRWTIRPGVEVYAAVLRAEALDVIRAAGGATATSGLLQFSASF